jgi:YD repeat-containing protein
MPLGVAFGLLLVLCMAVPVMAESEDQSSGSPVIADAGAIPTLPLGAESPSGITLPTGEDMSATADRVAQAVAEDEAALGTPAAVREREASLHAYENLSPVEAQELLATKFADVLASLNNDPSRYLTNATLEKPLGETAAQVTSDGTTSVMEGPLPVRAEDDDGDLRKVDLALEKTNDGWVPANPLVEVAVDPLIEEGIEVGDEGLTISQVGAEESIAQPLGDKNLFFGEVEDGKDVDLLVSPISGGVELFDMLRSVNSPETLRFHIDTPQGAEVRPTPSGGAEVVGGDGAMLAEVPAPRAVDAQGQLVQVTLEVEGEAIVLDVPHRSQDAAYPILVDPEVIDNWYYSFYNNQSLWTLSAWGYQESQNGWLNHGTSESMWPGRGGLFFASAPGNLPGGQWGQYLFSAPNANSYFEKGTLVPFWRNNRGCSAPNPYPEPYDYDGMWYQGHWNESGVNLPDFNQANQLGYADLSWGQTVIFGMSTSNGISIGCWRDLGMMGLQLWLNDWDYPYLSSVTGSPSGWVKKGTSFTINAEASDGGLGVQRVRAFGVGTQEWNWNQGGCAGTFESPCGNNRSGQITIATSGFPYEGRYDGQGKERTYSVQAIDPTDKRWALERSLWLDGTPSVISLKGQLATATDQVGTAEKAQETTAKDDELSLPTYKLEIDANDGADSSGVKEIKVFLDQKTTPEEVKLGSCGTSCPQTLAMTYTLRFSGFAAGKHSLRVVTIDKVGNESDPNRNIEFEYIPATGMKEEYVLQHFRLPDGNNYAGEAEYHGPEVAVNVMNGNVVFHERDIDIDTERAGVEVERVYNSQQPIEKDTQWGRGWSLAQTPALEPQAGQTPPQKATVMRTGAITSGVSIPQSQAQTTFSSRLHATITRTSSGGYEVEPVSDDEVSVFNSSGRLEEVVLGDNSPSYLEPEEGEQAPPSQPTYASSFGSSGTGNGQFNHPAGIAIDLKGNIWIVDQGNDRVEKFNAAGEFQSAFGSSGTGDGQFGRPTDIAIDSASNLWVTDAGNSRVEKFNEKGEFLAKFGSYGTGNGQFSSAESIAIDAKGNIWVGDTYNGRVQKFTAAGAFVKVVGTKGSGQGQMVEATGVDIGPGGNVWVADWGNQKVLEFNEAGEFVRQFGTAGSGNGQFARPDVIEVDSKGNVWVGDQNNGRVQQFNQSGEYVAKFGSKGTGQGQFTFGWPMGLASDTKGNLWVADTGNNRVQRWQIPNYVPAYASSFGSAGTGNGQFNHPADVAVDGQGNLWVADKLNNRIEKFNAQGEFLANFGTAGTAAGQLGAPSSIAFDAAGNFWVAERTNNRIQKFNAKGESLKTVGAGGSGNGQFSGPEGITIDAKGNIWVSDTYNYRVQEFNEKGEFLKVVNPAGLGAIEPTGIDTGPGGNIWVTDWSHNRVVTFSETGGLVRSFGSAGPGDGQFAQPDAVDVDAKGNVWIGDQNNGRIQLFNQSGEYVAQFGAKGASAGQFNFSYPFGIGTDNKGSIWVADANNNRVQRWTSTDSVGGGGISGPAPYFNAPVVDYEYSEGKLTGMQLEDEASEEDPQLALSLTAGQVTGVDSEEAGDTDYEYTSGKLSSVKAPDGQTQYVYDASGRMTKVTLPNGTYAEIVYDSTSRAISVKVDPAGPEVAQTTKFSYSAEPRRTIVWGGGNPEITYDIGEDGSVFKWQWAETPPAIASISGSLWSKKGEEIENKDHTLFVTGSSPHEVASIRVIENGNAVVAEKTCKDESEPPAHNCDQPAPLEWITNAAEHPAGRMDLEVIVTDFLGHQASERFFVIVPQQPPPDPLAPERPDFKSIKLFREEYGLDRNKSLSEPQLNELVLELLYDWERRDETAMRAVEEFGYPMHAAELAAMEYRRQYLSQAAEVIPQWAEENASSTYGGYYVDNRAGGIIYIGFTQEQAAKVAALKGSGQLMATGQVAEMPTPPSRSLSSVEATEASVASAIAGNASVLAATSTISVTPDTALVEVVATNTTLVQNFLTSTFGASAPIIVVPDAYPVRPASFSRYHVTGPVRAGDAIQSLPFCKEGNCGWLKLCTANVGGLSQTGVVRGDPVYTWFKLTAGHCFDIGGRVHRRANRGGGEVRSVGQVVRSGWVTPNSSGLYSDGEAIEVNSELAGGGLFYGNPHDVMPVRGPEPMKLAREYCWSGRNGGRNCGTAFRRRRVRVDNRLVIEMDVKGPSVAGDSGGPAWNPVTKKVVGIVSAHGPIQGKSCAPVSDPDKQGAEWCPRTLLMPFVPFANKNYPNGVLTDLGIDYLALGE